MLALLDALRLATKDEIIDEDAWRRREASSVRPRAGQVVFHANDPSDAVYLLLAGEARVSVGDRPRSRTTLLARGPALLGDRDVLADVPARESLRMATSGLLLTWTRASFVAEWRASEELRCWLAVDLARRAAASAVWAELECAALAERVAFVLEGYAGATAQSPRPAHLARLLGATERSIARALAELRAMREPLEGRAKKSDASQRMSERHAERGAPFHTLLLGHA